MNNRAYAIVTGIFIMVFGAGILFAVMWLSGASEDTKPYVIVTRQSVSGLQPESTVYFRGIAVGKVDRIRFDPEQHQAILIHILVGEDVPISRDTYATLQLQGVTGLSQLELNSPGTDLEPLPTSEANPGRIPLHPSSFERLSGAGTRLVAEMQELAHKLNEIMDDKSQAHVKAVLAQADAASRQLVELEKNLNEVAKRLPDVSRQAQETLAAVQSAAGQFRGVAERANRMLDDGSEATRQLNDTTLPQLDRTLTSFQRTTRELERFLARLRRDPQQLLLGPRRPPPGPGEKKEGGG
ncbi:MAG: MlaD family protein [Gammaproteobacteria bacterium]